MKDKKIQYSIPTKQIEVGIWHSFYFYFQVLTRNMHVIASNRLAVNVEKYISFVSDEVEIIMNVPVLIQ